MTGVLEERNIDLLKRKEVVVDMDNSGKTVSNEEAKKKLAEHFKIGEELIAVKRIRQLFGKSKSLVSAYVYKDAESFNKIEVRKKKVKKKEEAKPAAEKK